MRCATVASGTRKARAISGVVSPPRSRRVSATRASVGSTGWQAVNMRRSRSSPTSSSSAASRSGPPAPAPPASISRPSSSCFASTRRPRRRRSMAWRFATVMSQAPGWAGTPLFGHCSSALTSASWARSSATPTSRTYRASPAMSRADSMRYTASIARWVSEADIAADHTRGASAAQARSGRAGPPPGRGVAHGVEARGGRLDVGGEVGHLLHLADLDRLVLRGRAARGPGDRLLLRLHVDHPVAAEHLLGLGERAVDDPGLPAPEGDPRAHRRRVETVESEQDAGLLERLVVLHHLRHAIGGRSGAGRGRLVAAGDHEHHEAHRRVLLAQRRDSDSARILSSWARSSGVNASPKSSASNTGRISTSVPPSNGAFLSHSTASSIDFTCQIQNPATSSLVSANGPSITARVEPSKRTRLPFDVGWRPSPASIRPAFDSCSLKLPISRRSFSFGITPASEFLSALTSTMTFMTDLLVSSLPGPARAGRPRAGRSRPSPSRRTVTAGIDTRLEIFRGGVAGFVTIDLPIAYVFTGQTTCPGGRSIGCCPPTPPGRSSPEAP